MTLSAAAWVKVMAERSVPCDTSPEARAVQLAALRRLGVSGRARATFALNRLTRELSKAGIRMRHPDYDEEQVRLALARLMLGETLFREVYGDVEVQP